MKKQPLVSVVIPTFNRKEKLIRLIQSVQKSTYKNLEIIVVDDASTDGTYEVVKKAFPKVKIIRNEKELLLASSRNVGIKNSNGAFVFLIDDDNVVNSATISSLTKTMSKDESIGVVGPIMYYHGDKKRIWCAGITRNMFTSKTNIKGRNQIDTGQFNEVIDSDDFPNAFLVRKEVFNKIGLFDDENFPIHYDEADFCKRLKNVGYNILMNPNAKIWHDMPLITSKKDLFRYFHMQNESRAYYTAKNRVVYMKKYATRVQYFIFTLFFMPLFTLFHVLPIIISASSFDNKIKLIQYYSKGTIDGLFYRKR